MGEKIANSAKGETAGRARLVREMFDRIAGRYELLNTIMTAGLHRLWSRKVVRATGLGPGGRALDLACGTGSLTRDLAKKVGPEGYVLGIDFSREMLRAAQSRPSPNIEYRLGDGSRGGTVRDLRCSDHRLRRKEHPGPRRALLGDDPVLGDGWRGGVSGDSAAH